jgi:hypothetical protein
VCEFVPIVDGTISQDFKTWCCDNYKGLLSIQFNISKVFVTS